MGHYAATRLVDRGKTYFVLRSMKRINERSDVFAHKTPIVLKTW